MPRSPRRKRAPTAGFRLNPRTEYAKASFPQPHPSPQTHPSGRGAVTFPHGLAVDWKRDEVELRFSELVHLLESNGFRLLKEKGSIRYYRKPGHDKLIRVDFHGPKEVPTGSTGRKQ